MTEIFIEPELEQLQLPEVAEQWMELVSDLGMEGQKKLMGKAHVGDGVHIEKAGNPYMAINQHLSRVIRTLAPDCQSYNEYDKSTIPVDIISEIKKCVDNGWFRRIKIYYDTQSPDPFVVGFVEDSWGGDKFLIGRFGEHLVPFEQLADAAVARLRDKAVESFRKLKFELELKMQDVDAFLRGRLSGDNTLTQELYINDL